ncbi:hypothetical protein GCM10027614_21130 [Micromonospora vulcania]
MNSWAWTDETLMFADGWLALAGPNGSGKSLTASMLVTVLLDGEVSQKALSVSGEAVGTLIDRHTDRNPKEDRTGAWWLEYGYRDSSTGDVRYLTTGLWLRSQSSGLQKAFSSCRAVSAPTSSLPNSGIRYRLKGSPSRLPPRAADCSPQLTVSPRRSGTM